MDFLKLEGYNLDNTNVSYYSALMACYVNVGDTPPKTIFLAAQDDLETINGVLTVRLRFSKGLKWRFTEHEDCEQCGDNINNHSDHEVDTENKVDDLEEEEEREEK